MTGTGPVEPGTEQAQWFGSFDGFDFNAILAQSSSPLAAELLALKDDDEILPLEEMEEIALQQRGWFDDAVTREERRQKKLKQVLKMVFFLQVTLLKFGIFEKRLLSYLSQYIVTETLFTIC